MPAVYLSNRLKTAALNSLEWLSRPQRKVSRPVTWWAPDGRGVPLEHPELRGLWLIRGLVDRAGVSAIRCLAQHAILPPRPEATSNVHHDLAAAERECSMLLDRLREIREEDQRPSSSEAAVEVAEMVAVAMARRDGLRTRAAQAPPASAPLRTATTWEWHPYEIGRFTAPMRPHSAARASSATEQRQHLEGFEVFGSAVVDDWLCLNALEAQLKATEHALALAPGEESGEEDEGAQEGVARLRGLQSLLPSLLPAAIGEDAVCVFHQWQLLERGSCIAPHIDAEVPPADAVCTLSLGTGHADSVQVGNVAFQVLAGDLYLISGPARWEVDHEVHRSTRDRLSVTLRWASFSS
jgi:hypothetical protein